MKQVRRDSALFTYQMISFFGQLDYMPTRPLINSLWAPIGMGKGHLPLPWRLYRKKKTRRKAKKDGPVFMNQYIGDG